MKSIELGLIKGRHELPVTDYVFDVIEDVTDINTIDTIAYNSIKLIKSKGYNLIHLYITGLTVATIAVIKACNVHGIALTVWHYDAQNKVYYSQMVI